MHASRGLVTALLFALALSFAPASHADEDQVTSKAHKLYSDAKKALGDKHYKEAALGFEAASRLKPHAVALYTAAQAWELAGDPARAADAYTLALATPKLSDSQAERCNSRLAELGKSLGVLSVAGDAGTRIRLDDHMELGAPTKVYGSAGEHRLRIERVDGTSETKTVTLEAGKQSSLDSSVKPEAQPETPEVKPKKVHMAEPAKHPVESEKPHGSALKTIGFVSLGAGLGVLGGAALLAMSAKDAESTYNSSPSDDTYDHAKSLEKRTNIALIAGGVLTVAGAGLVIWQSSKSEKTSERQVRVRVGAGTIAAEGRF
jgi:hypothetical protein